ncbi:MAG: insulinase family protein [Clostridia bacterium]|nr:insulinase family protein [Clostridia bacterium]
MMTWNEIRSDLLREHYFTGVHKSGLPIYVFPKKLTSVYALFATRYGSVDTVLPLPDGREVTLPEGTAHFLEHKLFENADGSDAFAKFSQYGADANAYTTYNRTAYLFSCTDCVSESLRELLSFVTSPYFTEQTVKKEQGIIAEEIRMGRDDPWDRCYGNMVRGLYEKNPVRFDVCGSEESIARITPELLYECCRVFYHPSNMALVICGDVSTSLVEEAADAVLSEYVPAKRPIRRAVAEKKEAHRARLTDSMQVAKPLFAIGFKDPVIPQSPAERLRRDAAMTMLDEILFSRSGDFYNRLFEEGLITPSFDAGYSASDTFAFNGIFGESEDPEEVLSRLTAYLEEVRQKGIDRADLERCRNALYADEIRAYDSTDEIANRLLSFVFDDAEMFSYPTLLQEITREELQELLCSVYREEYRTLSVILPSDRSDPARE